MGDFTLGIDIGGTNFRIGMVSSTGEIKNFVKKSSSVFSTGNAVDRLFHEITDYFDEFSCRDQVLAVAVGLPSMVSKDKKTVLSTPNLKGFDNVHFGNQLSDRLGIPVYLDRDVNFLLQNDISKLGMETDKIILGFYVGTGFGNSIFMNGEFYCGKNGVAGELGHIPFYGLEDEQCTCGNYGCSEVRCSGKYLEDLTAKNFPDTVIRNVFKEHGSDPIILKFVRDLAIPIATEVNILDPDYIILAGGVLFMEGFPKDVLVESIHRMVRKPFPESNLEMFFSEHTQESGVYGSGEFAHKMLRRQKK